MEDTVATEDQVQEYNRSSRGRSMPLAVKGVLEEAANTNMLRYKWEVIKPLIKVCMDEALRSYEGTSQVAVGPVPAGADPDECRKVREQLLAQLDGWRGAPFTLQRLCEVVLEPRPQYASFSKLAQALEKLLRVTSIVTHESNPGKRPFLRDLGPVNQTPPPSSPSHQGHATDRSASASQPAVHSMPAPAVQGGASRNIFVQATQSPIPPDEDESFLESPRSREARTTPAFENGESLVAPGSPTSAATQTAAGPEVLGLEDVGPQHSSSKSPEGAAAVTSVPESPPRPKRDSSHMEQIMQPDRTPPPGRNTSTSSADERDVWPVVVKGRPLIGPKLPPGPSTNNAGPEVDMDHISSDGEDESAQ